MPGFLFKGWEFDLAVRYLRTKRKNGGIAVIAILSYVSVALAVTAYLPASLHIGETLAVVFGAFIATSLCTLIPALAASRLEPVDALRYE